MNDEAHNKTSPVLATAQFGSAGDLCKQRGTIDHAARRGWRVIVLPGRPCLHCRFWTEYMEKKSIARQRTFSLRAINQVDIQGDNSAA